MSNSSSTAYLAALQHQLSHRLVLIIHATGREKRKKEQGRLEAVPTMSIHCAVYIARLPVSLMCPPHSSPRSGALEMTSIRSCAVSPSHLAPPPAPVWAVPVLLRALPPALPLAPPVAPRAYPRSRRGLTHRQARIDRRAPMTQPELAPA